MLDDQAQSRMTNCPGVSGMPGLLGRKIDPIKCPFTHILDFLTECFHEGFQYNTTAGFRSVISVYHDPIEGITIVSNPRVSELLSGIYNNKPPQPKYTFI